MKDLLVVPDAPNLSNGPICTLEEFLRPYAIDDTEFATHTSTNSLPFPGKWSTPIKENGKFLRVLHNHVIVRKSQAYISERIEKGKAYEFFMDIDFDLNAITSAGFLDDGELAFNKYLYEIVRNAVFETEIGRHWCKEIILSSKPGHPNKIHVNADMTCQDRNLAPSIMYAVSTVFKDRFPEIDWKGAFDRKPYETGLRMLGCCKPGDDVPYQVYNPKTGKHEETNLNVMARTSIRSHLVALGGSGGGGGTCSVAPEIETAVKEFVGHLKSTQAFGTQQLSVNKVRLSGGRFLNVMLADQHYPYIDRAHQRRCPMHLFISASGVWLKCKANPR